MIHTAKSSTGQETCTSLLTNRLVPRQNTSSAGKWTRLTCSNQLADSISLICDADNRLGRLGGATEIKQHPFFRGVVWDQLRRIRAPFEPKLSSAIDTQNFPIDEIPQTDNSAALRAQNEAMGGEEASMSLPFIGYTYKRFDAFRGS